MASLLAGRYELETVIAQGGMGTVYRGIDTRLHRRVAIKVLKEHLAADERFVERFRREARSVASLSHPNIASLYDYAEEDGKHFIVMELVDGTDLASLLRTDSPLGTERSTAIAEQICLALEQAHSAGIVHRDMKPGNVLVAPDDHVKVTDFGIARAAGDSTLTATGSILGTAHYLAPEQAAGKDVTPATDIYALGVILFEMLTGAVPFEGDSPVAVATRHVNEVVPAPSALDPSVPLELDAVVLRATSKDPKDRYATAAEMAAALRSNLGQAPTEVVSAPISPTAHLPLLGRPYGRRVAQLLAVLALLALGLLGFRLLTGSDEGQRGGGAGDRARRGEVRSMPIPDVRGMAMGAAAARLESLGFRVEIEGDPAGVVSDVSPPVDSKVPPGTPVTLTGEPLEETVDEDDDEKDDEESDESDERGPPPHAEGNGKGKSKGKDKDKGKEKKDK